MPTDRRERSTYRLISSLVLAGNAQRPNKFGQ